MGILKRHLTGRRLVVGLVAVFAASGVIIAAQASGAEPAGAAVDDGRCAPGSATPPAGATWQQSFGDEFNTSTLDESKWNTFMDFAGAAGNYQHNSNYLSYALEKNIILDGAGTLKLRANKETVQGTDPVGTWEYSQGFMASHDKFFQRYGYWMICAKFPAGKGLWPAFWSIPQDRSWPPEFDIAEWFGGGRSDTPGGDPVMVMAHATGPNWHHVKWHGEFVTGDAPTTGWHTYGLEWREGYAAYYIDGVKHHEVIGKRDVPNKDMYIVLNSGVSCCAGGGGPPDHTTMWPNDFEVDYVRVYK